MWEIQLVCGLKLMWRPATYTTTLKGVSLSRNQDFAGVTLKFWIWWSVNMFKTSGSLQFSLIQCKVGISVTLFNFFFLLIRFFFLLKLKCWYVFDNNSKYMF